MRLSISRGISMVAMIGLLQLTSSTASALSNDGNLFFIKRSKNANEVHFDAQVEDCRWRREAVDSYWRELAEGPHVYEEIKWFEKPAYGFDVERLSDTEIVIALEALPARRIMASLSRTEDGECRLATRIRINERLVNMRSVYVYAEENLIGWPTVHYIDILGVTDDGQVVFERIPKTEKGSRLTPLEPDASRWESGAPTWGR